MTPTQEEIERTRWSLVFTNSGIRRQAGLKGQSGVIPALPCSFEGEPYFCKPAREEYGNDPKSEYCLIFSIRTACDEQVWD
ncbi:hypothetical protein ALO_20762 [Acetonema longum DSM 6540]|uniref:Uncharacterized protein n=1 Tax=Acetonema longum DSM 6540 TaxID=1009370 RepID=F7NPV5_9FIRM|nr:hypothetical protein ALO_20762 [Acetonema longum DSM 6540]